MALRRTLRTIILVTAFGGFTSAADREYQWPHWRGPWSTGVAPHATPPLHWSESKNIRWRTKIPGLGHSSPIVWEDRVYLTTAIPLGDPIDPIHDHAPGSHDNLPVTYRHRYDLLALDRATGKVVWQRTLNEALPHEGGHFTASQASASPVTDGEHIYAHFGSRGLYALNRDGEVLWDANLGTMQTLHAHGEGSSPTLYDQTLVVNWDHEGQSFLSARDSITGREKWRVDRDEVTSWASPIVVQHEESTWVVVSGTNRIRAYNLDDGKIVWECGGLSSNIVASPVYGQGMVFAASSYDHQALLAISLHDAHGDLTGTNHIAWSRTRATPYVPSLLLYGDWLYFLRHYQGILTRAHARTGEEPFGPFRLGGIRDVYASPVAGGGRVYITDRSGLTAVLQHDGEPHLLTTNQLRDTFSASAALVGAELYLRGEQFLYCIAEE